MVNRKDVNPESKIPESATFHAIGDSNTAIVEVTEPMVQLLGEDKLNHAVVPMIHNLLVSITRDDKIRFEVTFDTDGSEESSAPIEIPKEQVQELFDWLKKNEAIQ